MATIEGASETRVRRSSHSLSGSAVSLSTSAIGRLISGFGELDTAQYRDPVTETERMAKACRVTFRPLPRRFDHPNVLRLREQLRQELEDFGVTVVPWEKATVDFYQHGVIPLLGRTWRYKTRGVLGDINAVIDVDRPRSPWTWLGILFTELLYLISGLFRRHALDSLPAIARLTLWAEDLAVRNLMDHRRTQVLTLSRVDARLVKPGEPYPNRVRLGLAALAKNLAHLVIGFSGSKISMINLNMADSIFDQSEIRHFTRHVLVPKLFVPIVPLLQSHFELEHHAAEDFPEIADVADMGRQLGPTGLLPKGHQIKSVLCRRSRNDIVRLYADGRTGVSFGFIACVEKPRYEGPREIPRQAWDELAPSKVYPASEVRRNSQGRYYARVHRSGEAAVYRQIPDLWISSSRSGSDKTALVPDRDVIRIGYNGQFRMSLPEGTTVGDLKPSYDIRVMVAMALSASLYMPEFIEDGAAIFHFHGYPHRDWFWHGEYFSGARHPTVPCGTFEAATLNFQAIARLANASSAEMKMACTIEPDHGTNILTQDWQYLVDRVREGVDNGEISLGSRHFHSLLGE